MPAGSEAVPASMTWRWRTCLCDCVFPLSRPHAAFSVSSCCARGDHGRLGRGVPDVADGYDSIPKPPSSPARFLKAKIKFYRTTHSPIAWTARWLRAPSAKAGSTKHSGQGSIRLSVVVALFAICSIVEWCGGDRIFLSIYLVLQEAEHRLGSKAACLYGDTLPVALVSLRPCAGAAAAPARTKGPRARRHRRRLRCGVFISVLFVGCTTVVCNQEVAHVERTVQCIPSLRVRPEPMLHGFRAPQS